VAPAALPAGKNLDPDWRASIPARLAALGLAWQDEGAWTGVAVVGGVELPAQMHGMFGLDEVIVHGWDLAAASGQPFEMPPDLVQANLDFIAGFVAQQPAGTPGLFAAPVAVPADAPPLDRLLGLTGRDPYAGGAG
jgi:uncharacterized protein (TIGR03086 family)